MKRIKGIREVAVNNPVSSRLAMRLRHSMLLVALLGLSGLAQAMPEGRNVETRFVSEVTAIEPGKPFWVLLEQTIRPGWHTYWINPGDSGAPTQIKWDLPEGFVAGEIQWPFPERIPYGPLVNFGYSDYVAYPVQITPPANLPGESVTLSAKVNWLVCADICIPEKTRLDLVLPIGPATVDDTTNALFQAARQRIPADPGLDARWSVTPDDKLQLVVDGIGGDPDQVEGVEYFPYVEGVMANPGAQELDLTRDSLRLTLDKGWDFNDQASLDGIVVVYENVGNLVASAFVVTPSKQGTAAVQTTAAGISLWWAFVLAFLGGVILNLMPCVFPVLSIKVLSLVQQVGEDRGVIHRHGWVYLLGVVLSFTAIAAVLVALRAGGAQIGWGFQLQSPWVIGLLVYLFFLIGLNLSGFFEVGTSLMGVGGNLLQKQGYGGSFATGVLATFVAAPCTAPFMATAIGFALTQSNSIALAIFAALGLGMAAPYVLLCYSPALLRLLPRPGVWMTRFKELLAFPMYASAVWLVWVLTQQAGATGVLAILAGVLLLVFAIWLVRGLSGSLLRRRVMSLLALGVVGLALALPGQVPTRAALPGSGAAAVSTAGGSYDGPAYTAYSAAELARRREQGPVFVNFTAAWCITCKVNEAVALDREAVKVAFEARGIHYLKGDWTNENPEITRQLEAYGRSGVPLYLLFPGGGDSTAVAQVLPQILTEGIVLEAVSALPTRAVKASTDTVAITTAVPRTPSG